MGVISKEFWKICEEILKDGNILFREMYDGRGSLMRGGSIGLFESSSLSLLWGTAVAHGGVLANCGVGGAGLRLLVAHDGKVT